MKKYKLTFRLSPYSGLELKEKYPNLIINAADFKEAYSTATYVLWGLQQNEKVWQGDIKSIVLV